MKLSGKALFVSLCLLVPVLWAETKPAAPAPSAHFLTLMGTVEVAPAGQEAWKAADQKMDLFNGDRVRTGKGSRAVIKLPTAHLLRLTESSTLTIQIAPATTNAPVAPAPAS